jgi:PKHD-type hydroxylase
MMLAIPNVLTPEQVAEGRRLLESAEWVDGRITAGHQGAHVKNNQQLPPDSPVGCQLGNMILEALGKTPLFIAAALPLHVVPPLFNRYSGGQTFGTHVDGAIRMMPGSRSIRTDISCTLFFVNPDEYDGGELVVEDTYGSTSVKLPAGHMILYPATSQHKVTPVTRGTRLAAFFWVQSMVRDAWERRLLFEMDVAIQRLGAEHPTHPSVVQLTSVYHNLLRKWAET